MQSLSFFRVSMWFVAGGYFVLERNSSGTQQLYTGITERTTNDIKKEINVPSP